MNRDGSPTHWDLEDKDTELGPGSSNQNSCAGSPEADEDEDSKESGKDADGDPLRTPAATLAVPSATSTPCGQTCKSMADSIAEVLAHKRENHIKIAKINTMAKTECSSQWEIIKWCTNMELERSINRTRLQLSVLMRWLCLTGRQLWKWPGPVKVGPVKVGMLSVALLIVTYTQAYVSSP